MDRWEMGSLARLWSSGFPLYRFFRGSCPSFPIKPVLPGVRGADLKKYVIHGGRPLYGKVEVSGAKNAAVGIIPAALLVEGPCRIENIPAISDVDLLLDILRDLGARVRLINRTTVEVDCTDARRQAVPYDAGRKLRASYYLMGAMLGRFGQAEVPLPGGCDFGSRPIDQHLKGFAALGAECTVFDYSPRQLESERMVAQREGYDIRVIRGDMTKPLPFEEGEFDLIFHPVSNCYVQEVKPIFKECYRLLAPGGILLSGLDNGINFLFVDEDHREELSVFPFDPLKNPEQMRQLEADGDGVQFSHTMEEQVGGQLEAGFRLTHLYEDTNGAGTFHEHNIPCYLATRAVKEA